VKQTSHSFITRIRFFLITVVLLTSCTTLPQKQLSFVSRDPENNFGFHWVQDDDWTITSIFLPMSIRRVTWLPNGSQAMVLSAEDTEYYLWTLDGIKQPICLSCNVENSRGIIISPSGEKIVIRAKSGLYLMQDGALQQIANACKGGDGISYETQWAPDEQSIVFVQYCTSPDASDLYRIDLDSLEAVNLTQGAEQGQYFGIRWSPTGDQIAAILTNSTDQLVVMNRDGSSFSHLADWHTTQKAEFEQIVFQAENLCWSPLGDKLAFTSASASDNLDIFVINADGSGLINVSNLTGNDMVPTWSPDGKKLAFISRWTEIDDEVGPVGNANPTWSPSNRLFTHIPRLLTERSEIFVVKADGSNLTNLTQHIGKNYDPIWSPDGKQIAFVTDRDGNSEVYLINADGSNLTNISNSPSTEDFAPAWRLPLTEAP